MILKIVTFFLIFMLVLGMFGKWRRRLTGKPPQARLKRPAKCPRCGRFLLGGGPCSCGRG